MTTTKKVFVGLSGGVDSGVAAALLMQQGYDVQGIYMKNWSRDIAGHKCPWQEDLQSARSVAAHLNIPFAIYDLEKEYFEEVTQYMIDAYKKGLTPNPDVMCNQKIKFDTFYNKCLSEGADFVATGHYAKMQNGQLTVANDASKDQTYFLYRISPGIASKVLFPLGDLKKTEVRVLAKKHNLPNFARPDSQGLCFVGNIPMRDFLSEFIKSKKGSIVDDDGIQVGAHDGAFAFTLGQRHGLGIGGGKPYFVYRIDATTNTIYVTSDENSALLNKKDFTISDCTWWQDPKLDEVYGVRVRYRSSLKPGKIIETKNGDYAIRLETSERAIAPGQSAVIYDNNLVIGGGIIQ